MECGRERVGVVGLCTGRCVQMLNQSMFKFDISSEDKKGNAKKNGFAFTWRGSYLNITAHYVMYCEGG